MRIALAVWGAAAMAVAPAAHAAPKPITGSLSANGATVIALSYAGASSSARVAGGRFSVRPAAQVVTLSVRDAKGAYLGPVVVGAKGKLAVLGVRAGTKLGRLKLAHGFAKPAKRVKASHTDRGRTGVTRRGRPIAAGRFGLVSSRAVGRSGPGEDLDLDGVPNAFDVDDNGNLVLDNNDASGTRRRQVAPAAPPQATGLRLFSNFPFSLEETLNANAGGVTRAQIDDAMTRANSFVGLVFFLPDGVEEAQLDCGGLSYCSAGGTGKSAEPFPNGQPFPSCCDSDGDGLGTITRGASGDFQLRTVAPSEAIGSGDTYIEQLPDGSQLTGSLNYMFNTTPAVKSYVEGDGTAGTVTYPATASSVGTSANPLPLHADDSGDYRLELTLWRPQRAAIPEAGEPDGFVDLGKLLYQVTIPNAPQHAGAPPSGPTKGAGSCSVGTALTSNDPGLTPQAPFALADGATDAPSDPANTLSIRIDFTKCLAQAGQSLTPGDRLNWEVQADSTQHDVSAQGWWVCRPASGQSDCRQGPPVNPQGPPVNSPPTSSAHPDGARART